jgi:MFS family permease
LALAFNTSCMRVPLPERFHILYQRNFRLYWTGQLISLTGMWMQAFAAAWVVLTLLDRSAFSLAIVNFAVAIPGLAFMLYGGLLADRYDRRAIMVATQAVLMVIALLSGVLIATGMIEFWQIIVISFLVGTAQAFDMPAQQALVPSLVKPREIPQAVALNQVIFNGSRLLGPALAGVLVAVAGLASAYFANGISYIAVIVSLILLRLPRFVPATTARVSAVTAIQQGIGYVWRSSLLRALMGMSAATSFFVMPCLAVLSPAYVKDALNAGPGVSAILMAASGGASLAGAFSMLWVPASRRGAALLVCVLLQGLALFVMAVTSLVPVAVVSFGCLSLGMGLVYGLNATTIQEVTADQIRGRVMSVSGLMFSGVMPIATIAIGASVEVANIRMAFAACGGMYLLLAGYFLLRSGLIGRTPQGIATPASEPQTAVAG